MTVARRDRAVRGAVLGLALLAIGGWWSQSSLAERWRATHAERAELLRWLEHRADEMRALRRPAIASAPQAPAALAPGALLVLAARSARDAGLAVTVERGRDRDRDPEEVAVEVPGERFDALIAWLDDLQRRHDVQAVAVSFARVGESDRVHGSVRLRQGVR